MMHMNLTDNVQKRFDAKYLASDTPWVGSGVPTEVKEFAKLVLEQDWEPALLDIGCGNGWLAIYFAKQGIRVDGIDSSPLAIKQAKKMLLEKKILNVSLHTGNALNFPYKKDSFNVVFDRGLLHHLPQKDWPKYKKGLNKVLQPGGLFYLGVFSDDSIKKDFNPKEEKRLWNKVKDQTGYWTYDHFFNDELIHKIFGSRFDILSSTKDKKPSSNGSVLLHYAMRKKL